MAYNRKDIYAKAQQAIKNNELFFIEDIVAYLPISKPTFYEFFPVDSNEFNTLKELLEANKVSKKVEIRKKLFKSEKAAELLALYRLICSKEEHQLLNQQYIEHSGEIKTEPTTILVTSEQAKKDIEKLTNG
jgi:hypothetical protein